MKTETNFYFQRQHTIRRTNHNEQCYNITTTLPYSIEISTYLVGV